VLLRPPLSTRDLRQVIRCADLLQQPQHTARPGPRHVIEPRWGHLRKPIDGARLPGNLAIVGITGGCRECHPRCVQSNTKNVALADPDFRFVADRAVNERLLLPLVANREEKPGGDARPLLSCRL
jgi:hypothetical protein